MAQPTPTRIRLMPMIAMMVPVTTGGKKRSSLLTIGAMSIETRPAPMIAPKIARAPSTPGIALANATIGPTAAKVTPIITGSLMPNQRVTPSDWISVTMPQAKRSAEISSATCSGVSFSARPTISGTAIAPAYITSTCCRPSAASRPVGSLSSTGWTVDAFMDVSCQWTGAPASNQRLISARSSSVICVALFSGISFSTTACW